MAVVTFNKKYLFRLLSSGMTDRELESQTMKFGFEVERMDAEEVAIEITPNRPDLYGAVGFARSLKNFMHRSKRLVYEIKDQPPEFSISVGKEVASIRPFMAGMAVHGLKLDDASLADIINFAEKLSETYGRSRKKIAIGMHDLSDLEPPFHYNAYEDERFVPLNSDKEKYFSEAVKENAKGIKYGGILKDSGKRYPALKDNHGVLSLIPIINAQRGKVTVRTRDLLVVADGTQEDQINKTADVLAAIFMDLGAEVRRVEMIYPGKRVATPLMEDRYISIPFSTAEGEIGVDIGFNNIISLANKMGYEAALQGKDVRFRIPSYRLDVINEQDIVEDIAIAYGYDYIKPVPIPSTQAGRLESKSMLFDQLSEEMVGMGFSEEVNTYLTNEETNFTHMRIKDIGDYMSRHRFECVKLKNAKAQSVTMMRTMLLPHLLRNLGMSTHEKMPQRLFELDLVFSLAAGIPAEEYHLAGVSAGPRSNFNQIKGVVEAIAYFTNIGCNIEKYGHESFIEGRCAKVSVGKRLIGLFGEIHPEVLNNFEIEEPASAFELDLTGIIKE